MNIRSILIVCFLGVAWFDSSTSQPWGRGQNRQKWNNRRFFKKVERRIKNGRQVFSPRALGMIRNGWGKKNIHNKLNKAFGLCDIPDQDVVKNMFPGLFQSIDDIYRLPEMQQNIAKTSTVDKLEEPPAIRNWQALPSRRVRIPKTVTILSSGDSGPQNRSFSRTGNLCDCCKVDRYFETYDNVTVGGISYEVIRIPNEDQFFAIERCPESPRCIYGGCIQRYTRQPILIWNDTKPYYPPLDFAQFDFPTHCEWANIGQ
ncbi:uncharacterized protein LOC134265190 [Saccostrea cucullata]|uniref:uncharacterized protein LOC134265190 n=1 Tax=Saccostrea cuccullata TaxID=36930 RepID=UPI002ED3BFD8